jgi:tRNA pseudouridine38-40 synthase
MRYFLDLSYNGTRFNGWQRQPNDPSVQATIEQALGTLLRVPTEVVGCGRTDAGVHASRYVAHFDAAEPLSDRFLIGLNALVGRDISIQSVRQVADDAHARFDAVRRGYHYFISPQKDPFRQETVWHYGLISKLSEDRLNEAAEVLMHFQDFTTFCKTHDGAKTKLCTMFESRWYREGDLWVYHVSANRFLRGMVRLIVGMCLHVAHGRLTVEEVRKALETQSAIHSWSVPPTGLFLSEVEYQPTY